MTRELKEVCQHTHAQLNSTVVSCFRCVRGLPFPVTARVLRGVPAMGAEGLRRRNGATGMPLRTEAQWCHSSGLGCQHRHSSNSCCATSAGV